MSDFATKVERKKKKYNETTNFFNVQNSFSPPLQTKPQARHEK